MRWKHTYFFGEARRSKVVRWMGWKVLFLRRGERVRKVNSKGERGYFGKRRSWNGKDFLSLMMCHVYVPCVVWWDVFSRDASESVSQLPSGRNIMAVVGAGKPLRLAKLGSRLGGCVLVGRARVKCDNPIGQTHLGKIPSST